jgi:hypothetical protein
VYEVIVTDDVLAAQGNGVSDSPGAFVGWLGPVLFLLEPHPPSSDGDLSQLVAAAAAAAERFELVNAAGVEMPGQWMAIEQPGADSWGPRHFRDGVVVGAFAKDEVTPAQGATILRVLLGELHSRKVGARVSCAPAGIEVDDLPEVPAPPETRDEPASPGEQTAKRWFVQRGVRATTTTGASYVDIDWLLPDGTWSRNDQFAESWENTREAMMEMVALVTGMREDAERVADPAYTEIMGVLLTPGDGDASFPLPPAAIRDHGHVRRSPRAPS